MVIGDEGDGVLLRECGVPSKVGKFEQKETLELDEREIIELEQPITSESMSIYSV